MFKQFTYLDTPERGLILADAEYKTIGADVNFVVSNTDMRLLIDVRQVN